jgi:transposase-like protein
MNSTSESAVIPETVIEAVRHYSDLDVCHDFMVRLKCPTGRITCPKCGGDHVDHIKTRRMFRKQFSAKFGTIFEDSPLGLDKWFVAVWCVSNAKNGISSHELGRALGVTQKSAWHMLHRISLAMKTGTFKRISGEVETDETFIGGRANNMHAAKRRVRIAGRGTVGKAIVHGLFQRGGHVVINVVKDQKTYTLQSQVRKHVEPGSMVYSDTLASYFGLNDQYVHQMVDHAVQYVRGRVHTNGMANFWSLLKRTIGGTYVAVSPIHRQRFLDEQAFRYDKRDGTDGTRFVDMIGATVGRRLTWKKLTHSTLEMPNPT